MATFQTLLLPKQSCLVLLVFYLHVMSCIRGSFIGTAEIDFSMAHEDGNSNDQTVFRQPARVGDNNIIIGGAKRIGQHTKERPRRVGHARAIDDETAECILCDETVPYPLSVSASHGRVSKQFPKSYKITSVLMDDSECCRVSGTHANCTFCGLDSIPKTLPANITELLLGHNNLTPESLSQRALANYPKLKRLSLSTNDISFIPKEAFEGLPSLRCLCLQNNTIKMDDALNSSLAFQPLGKSLVYLKLNRNNKNVTDNDLMYPSYALSFLTNLKYLYLDGIPFKRFENPYQDYGKLTHLTLAGFNEGHCNLTGLQKHVFELVSLKYLDISDCHIDGRYVNESAFENLENLQTLNVSNNFDLGISTVGDFMYGLRNNKNFETLVMQRINPRFTPCIVIYRETLRYFTNTSLKQIEAMDNEIAMIEEGALKMLPKTLKVIDLTNNIIMFGDYIKDLGEIAGLETLYLDGSRKPYAFPHKYPTQRLKHCSGSQTYHSLSASKDDTAAVVNIDPDIKFIPVPPKLTTLFIAGNGMVYTLDNITFFSPNNLKKVHLNENAFQYLDGPIRGLEELEVLSMDNCFIKFISQDFLDYFPSLQYLSFYQNLMGESLAHDYNGSIFKHLKKLRLLSLSLNNVYHLNGPAFKNLDELVHLDLSRNRLGKVNFTISHMKKLQTLNLSGNQIRTLKSRAIADIDQINQGRQPLHLDLSLNPIGCDCDNLEFLEWLTETGVIGNDFTNYRYYCDFERQLEGYRAVITSLRQRCVRQSTIFTVVLCATFLIMLAIFVILAYRFRWTLRYWYHVARITLQPSLPPHQFDYDVFVSYSHKDDFVEEELIPRLQNGFGLRVQFHGLNFPVGAQIADSIHRAVTSSRKTLVVISRNMLQSHWCYYELMTAKREGIARGGQVLVFFFLEPMSSWEMSSEIAAYVRESTYIAYPPDPAHRPAFWRKLADDLGADMPQP